MMNTYEEWEAAYDPRKQAENTHNKNLQYTAEPGTVRPGLTLPERRTYEAIPPEYLAEAEVILDTGRLVEAIQITEADRRALDDETKKAKAAELEHICSHICRGHCSEPDSSIVLFDPVDVRFVCLPLNLEITESHVD